MREKHPTPEQLRERLAYNPETGALVWKKARNKALIGKESKSLDSAGYVQVNCGVGIVLKGHRVAWAIHYGEWPTMAVDHINGVRNDNRLCNLRQATHAMNCQNMRIGSCKSQTGVLGVHLAPRCSEAKRYRSKIMVGGKQIHLGGFPTIEEAHAAYVEAKRKLHAGCTL